MLFTKEKCPVCSYGNVGFRKCSDQKTLVLMCDECDAVWLKPEEIKFENAIFPDAPDFYLPGSSISISNPKSSWASIKDIKRLKFEKFIAGEGKAMDE
jgi:hypothetical protein